MNDSFLIINLRRRYLIFINLFNVLIEILSSKTKMNKFHILPLFQNKILRDSERGRSLFVQIDLILLT